MPVAAMSEERIEIPENVSVEKHGEEITVSGENGEVSKKFTHPRINISIEDSEVVLHID